MTAANQPPDRPGHPGRPGEPGKSGEGTGRGGEGGSGGAGGRGGGPTGEPGGTGGHGGAGGPGAAGEGYGRSAAISRWLDWAVRLAAVLSFLIGGIAISRGFAESKCQGRFNDRTVALAPAVNAERDAQRDADQAGSQLWLAVNPADKTPTQQEKVQKLFAQYQATLAARSAAQEKADQARAAHPLPTCGNPSQ